jgi:hypothetical protein
MREKTQALIDRLHAAQSKLSFFVAENISFDDLAKKTPDGFTVNDHLRMWVWHFWSHHRTLVRARGALEGDNPHFHVPHFIRQANEEFGRFVGELQTLTDDQLTLRPGKGQRSVLEVVEHVLGCLEGYFPQSIEQLHDAK